MLLPRVPAKVIHLLELLVRRVKERNVRFHPRPPIGGLFSRCGKLIDCESLRIVPIVARTQHRETAVLRKCSQLQQRSSQHADENTLQLCLLSTNPLPSLLSCARLPAVRSRMPRASPSRSPAACFRQAMSLVQKSRSIPNPIQKSYSSGAHAVATHLLCARAAFTIFAAASRTRGCAVCAGTPRLAARSAGPINKSISGTAASSSTRLSAVSVSICAIRHRSELRCC